MQPASLLVGVFQHGQSGCERRLVEDDLQRLRKHVAQTANAPTVVLCRPVALAQSDDEHLADSALERAAEVGVGLDARNRDDVVGRQCVLVPEHRLAPAVGADTLGFHLRFDRYAKGALGDAVLREQFPLAFRSGAAVAAHRRHDERFGAQFSQHVECRAHHHGKVGDAPTADPHRHAVAATNAAARRANRASDGGLREKGPSLSVVVLSVGAGPGVESASDRFLGGRNEKTAARTNVVVL